MAMVGQRRGSRDRVPENGTCELCDAGVLRGSAAPHIADCAPAHDVSNGVPELLIQLRVSARGLRLYWLDVEIKADAKLAALDAFLRRVWLECCGHLSVFRIDGVDYFSRGYEFGFAGAFGGDRVERRMTARLRDALPLSGN